MQSQLFAACLPNVSCHRGMISCRSVQREAHYIDLEAQPAAGAGQADLRHLMPADDKAETPETSAKPASDTQADASYSASTALNPTANAPISSKAAKGAGAKSAKKQAKAESAASPPSPSMQDIATNMVQQVRLASRLWTISFGASKLLDYTLLGHAHRLFGQSLVVYLTLMTSLHQLCISSVSLIMQLVLRL